MKKLTNRSRHLAVSKRYASPAGEALFPYLITPDDYEGKLEFKTKLKLDKEKPEVQAFLTKVETEAKKAYESQIEEMKAKGGKAAANASKYEMYLPFEDDFDKQGNETGMVLVNFKTAATYKDKTTGATKQKVLPLFDSKNQRMEIDDLWGGSIIKLSFTFSNPWSNPSAKTAGISLYINAVQVLDLRKGGGQSAESFGFDEEDGFEASNEEIDASVDFEEEEDDF